MNRIGTPRTNEAVRDLSAAWGKASSTAKGKKSQRVYNGCTRHVLGLREARAARDLLNSGAPIGALMEPPLTQIKLVVAEARRRNPNAMKEMMERIERFLADAGGAA